MKAIQTAMVIGAFPFSIVMVLQCAALIKGIWNDTKRSAEGVQATTDSVDVAPAE